MDNILKGLICLKKIFLECGFKIVKEQLNRWDNLPLRKIKFDQEFMHYEESDLLVKEALVVLQKQ